MRQTLPTATMLALFLGAATYPFSVSAMGGCFADCPAAVTDIKVSKQELPACIEVTEEADNGCTCRGEIVFTNKCDYEVLIRSPALSVDDWITIEWGDYYGSYHTAQLQVDPSKVGDYIAEIQVEAESQIYSIEASYTAEHVKHFDESKRPFGCDSTGGSMMSLCLIAIVVVVRKQFREVLSK